METTYTQSKSALMLAGLAIGGIFFTSTILIIPLKLMGIVILDIAAHHHFLMGFISLLFLMFCIKEYMLQHEVQNKQKSKNRNNYFSNNSSKTNVSKPKNKISERIFINNLKNDNPDEISFQDEKFKKQLKINIQNNHVKIAEDYEDYKNISKRVGISGQTIGL